MCVLPSSAGIDIGIDSDSVCTRAAHRIKSFESLASQSSLGRSSKLLHNQFRSLVSSIAVRHLKQRSRLMLLAPVCHVRYWALCHSHTTFFCFRT